MNLLSAPADRSSTAAPTRRAGEIRPRQDSAWNRPPPPGRHAARRGRAPSPRRPLLPLSTGESRLPPGPPRAVRNPGHPRGSPRSMTRLVAARRHAPKPHAQPHAPRLPEQALTPCPRNRLREPPRHPPPDPGRLAPWIGKDPKGIRHTPTQPSGISGYLVTPPAEPAKHPQRHTPAHARHRQRGGRHKGTPQ